VSVDSAYYEVLKKNFSGATGGATKCHRSTALATEMWQTTTTPIEVRFVTLTGSGAARGLATDRVPDLNTILIL